jgi:hypothetical protein
MAGSETDFTPKYSCRNISNKIEANVAPNVAPKQNGRIICARKLLILKVGTAGFEPTASCTPSKASQFPRLSQLCKPLKNIASSVLCYALLLPDFHSNMSLQYVSVKHPKVNKISLCGWIVIDHGLIVKKETL